MWPQSKMSTSSFLNRLDDLQQRLMAENRSLEDDRRDRNAETGSPSPRRPRMCKFLMCRLSFYWSYFWVFSSVILFLFWFHHILFLCTVLHFEQKRMFADDFTVKLIACSSFCSFLSALFLLLGLVLVLTLNVNFAVSWSTPFVSYRNGNYTQVSHNLS